MKRRKFLKGAATAAVAAPAVAVAVPVVVENAPKYLIDPADWKVGFGAAQVKPEGETVNYGLPSDGVPVEALTIEHLGDGRFKVAFDEPLLYPHCLPVVETKPRGILARFDNMEKHGFEIQTLDPSSSERIVPENLDLVVYSPGREPIWSDWSSWGMNGAPPGIFEPRIGNYVMKFAAPFDGDYGTAITVDLSCGKPKVIDAQRDGLVILCANERGLPMRPRSLKVRVSQSTSESNVNVFVKKHIEEARWPVDFTEADLEQSLARFSVGWRDGRGLGGS